MKIDGTDERKRRSSLASGARQAWTKIVKIDGKKIANNILQELKKRVQKLKEENLPAGRHGIIPHLAVVLTSDDPSSVSYVNQKKINAEKIGAKISIHQLPHSVTEKFVLGLLNDLNHLTFVHGIIVQRPLPKTIDKNKISLGIDPKKDVDGFHPASYFQPPLALAVLKILENVCEQALLIRHSGERSDSRISFPQRVGRTERFWTTNVQQVYVPSQNDDFKNWLSSPKIVVIGKGETGGKPIIDMLKKMNIEPLVIDSKTKNPEPITKKADIIITCVGKPNVIKPEMLKKGVILISVGLYKGEDGKMNGDYDEEAIKNIASFYTPTPGGVGPVNVAMLLKNLVSAAENLS